jgi:CheY-like chemotaxis protein
LRRARPYHWRVALELLIADDNADFRESLGSYLRTSGHRVRAVGDGVKALAALEALKPQAALLDIGMPGLTGLEVVSRARAAKISPGTVFIGISGFDSLADVKAAQAAGFDYYLVKPPELEQLDAILANIPARED